MVELIGSTVNSLGFRPRITPMNHIGNPSEGEEKIVSGWMSLGSCYQYFVITLNQLKKEHRCLSTCLLALLDGPVDFLQRKWTKSRDKRFHFKDRQRDDD